MAPMNNSVVSVTDLKKKYGGVTAVDGISFEVGRGEVFGLLGPNGAGKTTTLECLEGLRRADGGSLLVAGCDAAKGGKALQGKLGVQLQSSALPDAIRVDEAMKLICSWRGLPPRTDLLERFGVAGLAKKQYHELSAGQKRRLNLALALAGDPPVVVLDEPTAGLDVQGRAQLHEAIRGLKAEGVTILLATHDMAEAETLCDRIAILIRGRIAATGTPAQITAAGSRDTRITLRTGSGRLPEVSGGARFLGMQEEYGVWMCPDAAATILAILNQINTSGDTVEDLRVERPSLEERFLELVEGAGVK
jgi:ABC-type multidrug transport system, ATPase component